MSTSEGPKTATDYIVHHLTNLSTGEGYWALHWDPLFFSLLLGLVLVLVFGIAARRATTGVPGVLQNFVEIMVEFVDRQVKDTFHGRSALIAPLALTIFCWVFLWNAMDLVPVDALPEPAKTLGVPYLRVVPSTDLNATFWLSLSALLLLIFFIIMIKSPLGYTNDML